MRPEDFTPRLAFVRYLYAVAAAQSRQPMPMAAASILGFQDSIELFLVLAAEHLNANLDTKAQFDKYFVAVNDALKAAGRDQLSGKTGMVRLNQARVGLKHHGLSPDAQEIERFRNRVEAFFEDNTPLVFDKTEFAAVSLLDLVQSTEARVSLREAQRLAGEGHATAALAQVGTAFWHVMGNMVARQRAAFGASPFYFQAALTAPLPKSIFADNAALAYSSTDLASLDEILQVRHSLARVEDIANALCLGLDIRRYMRFRLLTDNDSDAASEGKTHARVPSAGEFRFCFDFVVDSAIRLQQFDFSSADTGTW